MMPIEEKFASTDLSIFKTEPLKLIAKQIVQYQNFKPRIALKKMNHLHFSKGMVTNYLTFGRKYLREGFRHRGASSKLYNYIDEWKEKQLQPLVPKDDEKAIERKHTVRAIDTKAVEEPVRTVSIHAKSPLSVTSEFYYGVKIENTIKIFDTEKECKACLKGLKLADIKASYVHISGIEEQKQI